MKKFSVLFAVAVLIIGMAVNAFAASAFTKIEVTPDTPYIDDPDTNDQGGSGQPIQFVENYGCGYSSTNDIIYFENVDFGANGAKSMAMVFGYGNDDGSKTTLSVFIDDPKSAPVATFEIGFTGGWEIATASEVTADCNIPGGVHTVYVQFTNEKSGSISSISFTEADPAPAQTEAPAVAEPAAPAETPAPVAAAQTADAGIVSAVIALAAASIMIAAAKKRK